MVALPALGVTRPKSMRSVVVLPAPLGPKNPTTCPESTVKSRWSTAVTDPNRLVNPSISMVAITTPLVRGRLVVVQVGCEWSWVVSWW